MGRASALRAGLYPSAMPHAEVTLPGATSSVPTARRFVESLLTSWGHADLGWAAAMCVSELAGNCALHARTDFTIRVHLTDDVLRIEVSDGSLRVPAQRSYGEEATTGRGLRLVEAYASSWGVETSASGKTVWIVLEPPAAAGGDGEDAEAADLDALLSSFGDDGSSWGEPRVACDWPAAA